MMNCHARAYKKPNTVLIKASANLGFMLIQEIRTAKP